MLWSICCYQCPWNCSKISVISPSPHSFSPYKLCFSAFHTWMDGFHSSKNGYADAYSTKLLTKVEELGVAIQSGLLIRHALVNRIVLERCMHLMIGLLERHIFKKCISSQTVIKECLFLYYTGDSFWSHLSPFSSHSTTGPADKNPRCFLLWHQWEGQTTGPCPRNPHSGPLPTITIKTSKSVSFLNSLNSSQSCLGTSIFLPYRI